MKGRKKMDPSSILFQFEDRRSAYNAFDTLHELGYRPVIHTEADRHQLHIHVDHSDLTSALEIVQAYGGTFVEQQNSTEAPQLSEHQAMQMSYYPNEQGISIPAHVINEDWTEEYAKNTEEHTAAEAPDQTYEADESYDHFSADVRI
jgi:hypothetical protein